MTDEKLNEIINKLPTDEELIELLRNIKAHCNNPKRCDGCVFYGDNGCQVMAIVDKMRGLPMFWNMDKIERIINL